jgi:hypothetical protein
LPFTCWLATLFYSMMAMIDLQSRGITEEQILQVNNFLEKNDYKIPINR